MDYSGLQLTYILPVYQDNKEFDDLSRLIEIYSKYDKEILKKIHFIFVDDCSPIDIQIDTSDLNFTLYRIQDDIIWNQGGARNLAVTMAKTTKLIMTDLDHVFPQSVLEDLIKMKTPKDIFKFRRSREGKKIESHPNTFFMSKSTYFKSLGVDEAFSGHYGNEDIYFIDLHNHLGTKFKKYRKEMIETFDHSHHGLQRDTSYNEKLLEERRKAIAKNDAFSAHSRLFLNFSWNEVKSNWI